MTRPIVPQQQVQQQQPARPVVSRRLLQQQLQQAGQISQQAQDPGRFGGGRAGTTGLFAQVAAAGIGAFAQNKVRKQLAERELGEQQAFSTQTGVSQDLAAQLGPEGRQALIAKQLGAQIDAQFKQEAPLSPEGKKALDIQRGFLPKGTSLGKPEDFEKRRETAFKETRDLRKEFTKNSGEFIKQRDAFSRIQASVEDPSAAGDLSLIFNYMKLLDPGSTVREGEFATAQNSAGVPDIIRARFNKVSSGERLAEKQRTDFTDRSNKLFEKAKGIQNRRIKQFEGIAKRNKLPVEDVLLDFVGGIDDPQVKQDVAESITSKNQPTQATPQQFAPNDIQAELKRRGLR
jgi:hypothetical protein